MALNAGSRFSNSTNILLDNRDKVIGQQKTATDAAAEC
jgi:hypothetical protein